MKYRIAIFFIFVLLAYVGNRTFEVALHPSVSAATAVDQVLDEETPVIIMRSYDRLANTVPQLMRGAVFLSAIILFTRPLYTFVKESM